MKPLRLLLVEDSDDDALLILQWLHRHGFACETKQVMSAADLKAALGEDRWDIILCDYVMPGFDGLAALQIVKDHGADIPVIIVSGTVGEDVAVASLKHGAQDYILKQNLTRLGPAVESELGSASERRYTRLLESVASSHSEVLEMILNGSALKPILDYIVSRVEELSQNGALCSILLTNDSGTFLMPGSSPSMPEAYNKVITPLKIGAEIGTCGRAAALKETVITEDITVHPNWGSVKEIVQECGLKSCWSVPVFSSGREVVGTMAIYYRNPRVPTAEELRWVESAARLVGVAIERGRSEVQIREQLDELLRWQNAMLNREDRVQQLKGEVNELLLRLGETIRYPSQA
ncbi:GAF domain-containing protein [Prosthecobacter fusiformis]|uniref:GAF domain-containing protein n=1 Tax=Prosthecobacter fusiformis TaxID=48464 RepID=A0A4R7S5V1_9BACT|nr:GAF domain-containing protein [Prosthecobacter fusiformis]TDU73036.1 GAF domain-containing protein [Prosthecobacter fusiformis]